MWKGGVYVRLGMEDACLDMKMGIVIIVPRVLGQGQAYNNECKVLGPKGGIEV